MQLLQFSDATYQLDLNSQFLISCYHNPYLLHHIEQWYTVASTWMMGQTLQYRRSTKTARQPKNFILIIVKIFIIIIIGITFTIIVLNCHHQNQLQFTSNHEKQNYKTQARTGTELGYTWHWLVVTIRMGNSKNWEINFGQNNPLPVPVKSFICSQSLIIFLITVFVRGGNFQVWNKSQNFLLTTKFVTGKPQLSPIWCMHNAD